MTFDSFERVDGYTEDQADTAADGDSLTQDTHYTLNYQRPAANTPATDFTLDCIYDKLKADDGKPYVKLKVTYTATVNENITVKEKANTDLAANTNNAWLDYNSDPYSTTPVWKSKAASATVYSYGIQVTKQDNKTQAPLTGATFTLSASPDGTNPIAFVGTDGSYRKAKTGEGGAVTALAVNPQEAAEKGRLTLSGLDVGTYYLTETKAPEGYVKPRNPVQITIADDAVDGQVNNGAGGYVELAVENSKGFTLPSTGGMGTVLFTAIGVVLMGGGLALLVLYLRRRNRAR